MGALVATVSAVKIDADTTTTTLPLALMGEHTTTECDHQCVKQHLKTFEKLPANVRNILKDYAVKARAQNTPYKKSMMDHLAAQSLITNEERIDEYLNQGLESCMTDEGCVRQ